MNLRTAISGFIVVLLVFASCERPPELSSTPRIEYLSVEFKVVENGQDSLIVTVSFEDGDGDLGNEDPDVNSLFILDSRLEQHDVYYIPPLSPQGSEPAITGILLVNIEPIFILGSGDKESAIFSLYIVDRAGNESNIIETPKITIVK